MIITKITAYVHYRGRKPKPIQHSNGVKLSNKEELEIINDLKMRCSLNDIRVEKAEERKKVKQKGRRPSPSPPYGLAL